MSMEVLNKYKKLKLQSDYEKQMFGLKLADAFDFARVESYKKNL